MNFGGPLFAYIAISALGLTARGAAMVGLKRGDFAPF